MSFFFGKRVYCHAKESNISKAILLANNIGADDYVSGLLLQRSGPKSRSWDINWDVIGASSTVATRFLDSKVPDVPANPAELPAVLDVLIPQQAVPNMRPLDDGDDVNDDGNYAEDEKERDFLPVEPEAEEHEDPVPSELVYP